jgi:hypothetical protein
MEAGDVNGPIRPLPPQEPEHGPAPEPHRRRGGLVPALIGVGVVTLTALVLAAVSGGPLPRSEPTLPPALAESGVVADLTTTTTTLPPRLDDLVPDVEGPLQLLQGTGDRTAVAYWPATARAPRLYETSVPRGSSLTMSPVGFDTSGSYLAYLVARPQGYDLHVGVATTEQLVQHGSPYVTSAVWHPADEGRLAWVVRTSDPQPSDGQPSTLYIGEAKPRGVLEDSSIAEIPPGFELAAWGDWGFALNGPAAADASAITEWPDGTQRLSPLRIAIILDPTGAILATAPGQVVGGNASGDLIVLGNQVAYESIATGPEGDLDLGFVQPPVILPEGVNVTDHLLRVVAVERDLFPQGTAAPDAMAISPDGTRLAVVSITANDTSRVRAVALEGGVDRIIPVSRPLALVGFIADGRYLALADTREPELVLVDWRVGAQYRVPLRNRSVLAAHL